MQKIAKETPNETFSSPKLFALYHFFLRAFLGALRALAVAFFLRQSRPNPCYETGLNLW
jgi:hypothetical protein